jgi:uncharacterized protein (TIGR02757 family)
MNSLSPAELKCFLDEKVIEFNNKSFIDDDPIQIPHQFKKKEDIEIASFLVCTIAWGNRKSIIENGFKMISLLDESPFEFVMNHSEKDLIALNKFVHRTFNGADFIFFIRSLKNIYKNKNGLEQIFKNDQSENSYSNSIIALHRFFFEIPHEKRIEKHIANPSKGSVAKRINLFLRWMIRKDGIVDFGLWGLSPAKLSCPLDIHSGNIARKLGLIQRKNNDLLALSELDSNLRAFDKNDPVKYDYALFGLGAYNKF